MGENILWKQQIPGRGHSSPVIVGDHVYVETADEEAKVQSVLSLSRTDGQQVWKTDLFKGNFETAMHGENTQASSTLAYDGERLFASFLNDRKIWVVALDLTGKGLGLRSNRYSMLVRDGKVVTLNVEAPGKFEVSDADTLLQQAQKA